MLEPGRPRRRFSYAVLGTLLSVGAPLGLALVRAAGGSLRHGLLADLAADAGTYLYVAVSTALVFSAFGFGLGLQADRLVELSSLDPLTGLANGRVLQARLDGEYRRSLRYGQPLSLLLIDLDGLKQINDRHGHRSGDAALRRVAAAIRGGARSSDLAARHGGDEFALLAPDTPAEAALALAERIRGQVAAGSGAAGAITASIGVATLEPLQPPASAASSAWLMELADRALYQAKDLGRNRVAGPGPEE